MSAGHQPSAADVGGILAGDEGGLRRRAAEGITVRHCAVSGPGRRRMPAGAHRPRRYASRHARRRSRPRSDGEDRQPVEAPRLRVPVGRDLRRVPLDLRLRPDRRAAAAQRQGRLVALDGAAARRRGRPRRRHPVAARRSGRPRATWPTSPTRWSTARICHERFRLDKLDDPHTCPSCGAKDSFTEARQFNLMFKTHAGPHRRRRRRGLPAARDGPGHVRRLRQRRADQPQEAAVRHRPGGQVVPQRDHARQLRVPHP